MSDVFDHLDLEGGIDKRTLFNEIKNIVRKTVQLAQPSVLHTYKSMHPRNKRMDMWFEILGFDILIDDYGQPWLLEVNLAPSFGTDAEIDKKVKDNMLKDAFKMLNITPKTKAQKIKVNALELQERIQNGRTSKETAVALNNHGEREMYKQIKYELSHLGNFEKINVVKKYEDWDCKHVCIKPSL